MRCFLAATLLLASLGVSAPAIGKPTSDEVELRRLDDRQRQATLSHDVDAMRALTHPNYQSNSPINRVQAREEILGLMKNGGLRLDSFTRTPESVVITGNVGVIMGREDVTPTAASVSGRVFGARPLMRRYTNIYIRVRGGWKLLARHVNVAPSILQK